MPPDVADPSVVPFHGPDSTAGGPARGRLGSRGLLIPLLLSLLFGATLIAWRMGIEERFVPLNFGIVEPGRLYRGGQLSRYLLRRILRSNHVGFIVDMSSKWEDGLDAREERRAATSLGIGRVNFSLRGNGLGDPEMYPKAIAAIVLANRQGKPVLVHCQSGSERTGGVVAVYRILVEDAPPQQAFAEMSRFGHRPHGNPKLIPFLEQHLNEWRSELRQQHVLPETAAIRND